MAAVLLALSAAALWGTADYFGGALSRRASALVVAFVAQLGGFAGLLVAWAVAGRGLATEPLLYGFLAGAFGAVGLVLLYRALALGTMSVVAPIIACAALVPFTAGLARGEDPAAIGLAGAALAFSGSALAAVPERRSGGARGSAILVAAGAAVVIGGFVLFVGIAGQEGDGLAGVIGARIVSLPLLGLLLLARGARRPLGRREAAAAVGIGLVDTTANTCFAFASDAGLLSLVSALAALAPITTILLAHLLIGERIGWLQRAGVVAAIAGAALVSAA